MSLTGIGVLTILATVLAFPRGSRSLLTLLILSLPFQAAVVFTFGAFGTERGLSLRYFVMMAFCGATLLTPSGRIPVPKRLLSIHILSWLFACYAVFTSYAFPRLSFLGEDLLAYRANGIFAPNSPASTNYTHSLNILLCVLTFTCVSRLVTQIDLRGRLKIIHLLELACVLAVTVVVWHSLSLYAGVWFPYPFFANNPAAMLVEEGTIRPDIGLSTPFFRPSGSFTEPSIAAPMLCGYLAYLLARYMQERRVFRNLLKCLAVYLVIFVLTSTTGYMCALLATCVVLAVGALRTLGRGDVGQLVRPLTLIGCLACCWALTAYFLPLLTEEMYRSLYFNVVDKVARDAGSRIAVEQFAASIVVKTFGLGTGLGGNLSFTLWGYVLSNLGVLGALLCGMLLARVGLLYRKSTRCQPRSATRQLRLAGWFLAGFLACGMTGTQVLFEPQLWVLLGIVAGWASKDSPHGAPELHARAGAVSAYPPVQPAYAHARDTQSSGAAFAD